MTSAIPMNADSRSVRDVGPARAHELPELVSLLGEAVPNCLPETVWQLPWNWQRYLVARDDRGALVAAGSLEPVDDGRAEIRGLVVAPDWQGHGLASEIVERLLERARARRLDAVCVTRKPGFFRRFGFRATPLDWVSQERRLAPARGEGLRIGMVNRLAPAPFAAKGAA